MRLDIDQNPHYGLPVRHLQEVAKKMKNSSKQRNLHGSLFFQNLSPEAKILVASPEIVFYVSPTTVHFFHTRFSTYYRS